MDDTIIFFASDNGCCAAGGAFGATAKKAFPEKVFTGEELEELGGPDSFELLGASWAWASSTPLRYTKAHAHAGGNTTPLVLWGKPFTERAGQYDDTPCHVMDLAPTILEMAGVSPPASGFDGVSLAGMGSKRPLPERTIFFELNTQNMLVTDQWRAVAPVKSDWELYDRKADPSESRNLADKYPEVVDRLTQAYDEWLKSMPKRTKRRDKE
jgi:arylsulfatase